MKKTKQNRGLRLSRETLRILGAIDLGKAKGGAGIGLDPKNPDQGLIDYGTQDFSDQTGISAVGCGSLAC